MKVPMEIYNFKCARSKVTGRLVANKKAHNASIAMTDRPAATHSGDIVATATFVIEKAEPNPITAVAKNKTDLGGIDGYACAITVIIASAVASEDIGFCPVTNRPSVTI